MATRLLIIHRQLNFAVTIKQALEQTGGFAVHPFMKAEAAFDFLRDHPQDIVLVDFKVAGRSGPRIVQQLRALQRDIAIVVTPRLSDSDVRNLEVQGTIDTPFAARDLIPVLMNALDAAVPEDALDNLPDEPISPMAGQMTTQSLGDERLIRRKQLGTTQNLGDGRAEEAPNRTEANIRPPEATPPNRATKPLDDVPPPVIRRIDKAQTKKLPEEPKPTTQPFLEGAPIDPIKPQKDPLGTRNLQNEPPPPPLKPFVDDEVLSATASARQDSQTRDLSSGTVREPQKATRKLPDMPQVSGSDFLRTRQLNRGAAADDAGKTRDLGENADDPAGTRNLGGRDNVPPTPPEFSSLDQVLQSFGFEPPPDDQDTPSVPTKDSDALRQFLATTGSGDNANTFDDVLGSIDPTSFEVPKQKRQVDFEGLVKSMRSSEPERRLPDRQQQLMDFILTSGMDSVLQEIEKTKTSTMPKVSQPEQEEIPSPPPTLPEDAFAGSSFQKLAQEEPPMPTLEENGTVSDLLVGISDSNFRDVLELLKDYDDSGASKKKTPHILPRVSETSFADDFAYADSEVSEAASASTPEPRTSYDFDFAEEFESGATIAQVVLNTTEENSTAPGEFSLDQLMTDINERLTAHQLTIRPLPSWDIDTTAFHAVVVDPVSLPQTKSPKSKKQKIVQEPSFLPEDFSTGEIVPPELPPLEASEVWTTRASEASREEIDAFAWDAETMAEPGYFEETMPANPVTAQIDIGDLFAPPTDAEPETLQENVVDTINWDFQQDVSAETILQPQSEIDYWETGAFTEEQQAEAEIPAYFDEQQVLPEASAFLDEGMDVSAEALDAVNWNITTDEDGAEKADDFQADSWDDAAMVAAEAEQASEALPTISSEEAYLAQLALNLTQVSLELSAQGTILTRNNEVVAVAGHLSNDDVLELRDVINNDWGTGGQGARLRFINLPSSGKDYMLYTTATDTELILSMIFAGTTPLRVIRQQGQRLSKALTPGTGSPLEPPQMPPSASPAQDEAQPRQPSKLVVENLEPHSYVWLVRDPNRRLNKAVVQSITSGLSIQLQELHWKISALQVREDYIYLLAEVPDDRSSNSIIRDLKQRSAEIAFRQDNSLTPQMLWADSYLVLSPGRELAPGEIQEFIDFQRMM